MSTNIKSTSIEGVYILKNKTFLDARGSFTKQLNVFSDLIPEITWQDQFYTVSKKHVFRGFHYQKNEPSSYKLINFLNGNCTDYLVDIRPKSASYGNIISLNISAEERLSILVPPSVAHGFISKSDNLITLYQIGCAYSLENDVGFNYKSIDIDMPSDVIISDKDEGLPIISL